MKKYLIYLDILGFENLPQEIAKKTGFDEDIIRQDFFSKPLKEKIEEVKREGTQVSKGISEIEGSDNYVLMVDDIQTAFEVVGKLTTIKIPHKDYRNIPLEIALDIRQLRDDLKIELINREEIIEFLKNDIVNPYRKYYEDMNGEKVKETFVVVTEQVFNELEPIDRKYCEKITWREKTFFAMNLQEIWERCKIFEFLERMGIAGSKLYDRINELYVPPIEYKELKQALEKERIVFITGTAEYGKTYTAVRLLWEYFGSKEYVPRWIIGGEARERIEVRKRLEEIERELKEHRIIYFEDPFGKTKYEKRERIEREIGTIIDCVHNIEDVYVIITTRDEVFKEFEKEHLSSIELEKFQKKINIKRPSYDSEKRKEILLKWAEAKDCKWLEDNGLKKGLGVRLNYLRISSTDFRAY